MSAAYFFGSYGESVEVIRDYHEDVKRSPNFSDGEKNIVSTILTGIVARLYNRAERERISFEQHYEKEAKDAEREEFNSHRYDGYIDEYVNLDDVQSVQKCIEETGIDPRQLTLIKAEK